MSNVNAELLPKGKAFYFTQEHSNQDLENRTTSFARIYRLRKWRQSTLAQLILICPSERGVYCFSQEPMIGCWDLEDWLELGLEG